MGAEGIHEFIFVRFGEESMFATDLFGSGEDMGQTGLPVCTDPVIGGIAISDQGAGEVLSEDGVCHVGGAVSVDVEESEVFIACKPHVMPQAVVTP